MTGHNTTLYSHPTNYSSFTGMMLEYPNEVLLNGLLAEMIIGTLFIIVFATLAVQGARRAFAAASTVSFIAATLLVALNVAGQFEWAFTVVMLVTAIVVNNGDSR